MKIQWIRAAAAGIIGTAVMTLVGAWIVPMLGMPASNPALMVAGILGGSTLLGWIGHFAIGIMLALIYAAVMPSLAGAPAGRGAMFSLAPWLVAMLVVSPLLGLGFFLSSGALAFVSLISHLFYGLAMGSYYGPPRPAVQPGMAL